MTSGNLFSTMQKRNNFSSVRVWHYESCSSVAAARRTRHANGQLTSNTSHHPLCARISQPQIARNWTNTESKINNSAALLLANSASRMGIISIWRWETFGRRHAMANVYREASKRHGSPYDGGVIDHFII